MFLNNLGLPKIELKNPWLTNFGLQMKTGLLFFRALQRDYMRDAATWNADKQKYSLAEK